MSVCLDYSVGVVIATYNGEKYISEQLQSIINNTVKPTEIIVTDGGSSDRTCEICEKVLCGYDISYRIIRSDTRLNVQQNFDRGLRECNCDYIFLSDQDDVWLENKIAVVLDRMRASNASLAFTNANIVDEKLNDTGKYLWETIGFFATESVQVFENGSFDLVLELCRHNVMTGMTMCLTEELKSRALPLPEDILHDKFIAFCGALSGRVVAIDEKLVLYRQHANNVVGTRTNWRKRANNARKYIDELESYKKMISRLLTQNESVLSCSVSDLLTHYKAYLQGRINFLRLNCNPLWAAQNIKLYKRYEYNKKVLIKDYVVRLFTRFGGMAH